MRIPPPRPSSEPKTPAATPPAEQDQPGDHRRRHAPSVGRLLPGEPSASTAQGRRCCGAYGQQRHVAGPLEGDRQLALVRGAGAGLAARLDLGALGEVAAEAVDLLVVDRDGLVGAERADLPAPAIAVVVVALLRAGGHWRCLQDGGGSPAGAAVGRGRVVRTGGRRGRRRAAGRRPGGWAGRSRRRRRRRRSHRTGRRTSRSSSSRTRASRLMTLSAVISSEVRFWPSLASYSRVRKRPSTNTLLPLRNCSAVRSARSPQTVTRYQSVRSSTHSPVCGSRLVADRDAELRDGTPVGRVPHLGVTPEVADDHDLRERHRRLLSLSRWPRARPRSRTRRSARRSRRHSSSSAGGRSASDVLAVAGGGRVAAGLDRLDRPGSRGSAAPPR